MAAAAGGDAKTESDIAQCVSSDTPVGLNHPLTNRNSYEVMTRPNRQLARDEVRLPNGEITQIAAGDTWVEFESAVTSDEKNTIVARYEINDIVTDAVNVTILDGEPIDGDLPVADYEWSEFRANAESGHLIPKKVLTDDGQLDSVPAEVEYILVGGPDEYDSDQTTETPGSEEIIATMVAAANHYNVDAEALADAFDPQHNYLQSQIFTEIVKPLILTMATTPNYDARNKDARQTAREIAAAMDWELPDRA